MVHSLHMLLSNKHLLLYEEVKFLNMPSELSIVSACLIWFGMLFSCSGAACPKLRLPQKLVEMGGGGGGTTYMYRSLCDDLKFLTGSYFTGTSERHDGAISWKFLV